ncbi:MAG: hypothetical protein D6735_13350 [Acidobacteria bacterium]|nr:MAG: hypothetical protein D6735_13350 [Acidobacteriota bacterium]
MKRIMIRIGVVVLSVFAMSLFGLWLSGILYIRLPDSKVFINGTESTTSRVYRSGNGDYLVFLDSETARFPVYRILNEGKNVGVPVSPVPSSYTKSVKTNSFVICFQCSVSLAGTEKLDLQAEVSVSPSEINFHVYQDVVKISF